VKKQRVLLITARSDIGGGPKYTLDFAHALQADSTVYLASPNDPPYGSIFSSLAEKYVFIPHRGFSLCAFFRLWRLVKAEKIDIVHSHGRGAGIYSRLLRLTGAKIIHSFHGIHREPTIVGRIKFLIDQILNPFTDGFVFVSESERNEARRCGLGSSRSTIVYPIVRIPKIAQMRIHDKSLIQLGSISRFDYSKGVDLLFSNLLYFLKSYPDLQWQFHLAGAGDLKPNIPHEIQSRVFLHGAISDPYEFLKNLDIYIANSRWESFNITVAEALASHLPTLLSRVSGHEYFINAGVATGFALDDPRDFCEKLLTIIRLRPPSQHEWIRQFHTQMYLKDLYLFLRN